MKTHAGKMGKCVQAATTTTTTFVASSCGVYVCVCGTYESPD